MSVILFTNSAYFVKTPPRVFSILDTLQISFRHIDDVHEDFSVEKNILTILQCFELSQCSFT